MAHCNSLKLKGLFLQHVLQFAELTQEVQVARPQQVQFDLGLQKGRRRLNQQYKEAVAKVAQEGGTYIKMF